MGRCEGRKRACTLGGLRQASRTRHQHAPEAQPYPRPPARLPPEGAAKGRLQCLGPRLSHPAALGLLWGLVAGRLGLAFLVVLGLCRLSLARLPGSGGRLGSGRGLRGRALVAFLGSAAAKDHAPDAGLAAAIRGAGPSRGGAPLPHRQHLGILELRLRGALLRTAARGCHSGLDELFRRGQGLALDGDEAALVSGEGLVLEESLGQALELVLVLGHELGHAGVRLGQQLLHLGVDALAHRLGDVVVVVGVGGDPVSAHRESPNVCASNAGCLGHV
mmetsp:Transcript_4198/g.17759  ORF Transcript_4198/g.17759 Transcript_4198/m.17759 type:complete len:276 (+) Transcript_4198:128-955(+)